MLSIFQCAKELSEPEVSASNAQRLDVFYSKFATYSGR